MQSSWAGDFIFVVVDLFYQDGNEIYVVMLVNFLTQTAAVLYTTWKYPPPLTMKPTSKESFLNYFERLETVANGK